MENFETQDSEKINPENPFSPVPAVSIGKNAINYGALLGGISVLYSIILWLAGLTLVKSLGYVSFLFVIGVMAYGTIQYRNKHMEGYMQFGQAFTSNFLIGLYATIISAIFSFILFTFIDPSLVEQIRQQGIEQAMAKNPQLSQEQIEQGMDKVKFLMSPAFFSIMAVFAGAIFNAILALLIALFQKKDKPLIQSE